MTMTQWKCAVLGILVAGWSMIAWSGPDSIKTAVESSTLSDAGKKFVVEKLLPLCEDAAIVAAVAAQNAGAVTLDEIKKIDAEWQAAEDELPIQKEKLGNATAQALKEFVRGTPAVAEAFVMDNQGAIVGENNLTSDYWQGDEDKWVKSFAAGAGGVDVGAPKFDKSANITLQQVSLPVTKDGKAIGAITFGLDISRL